MILTRLIYRLYRRLKVYIIVHQPWGLTWLFFSVLPLAERIFSTRRDTPATALERASARRIYFLRYQRENPPFRLVTDHPLAAKSDDHLWPRGTILDNSLNPRFNAKLYHMLGQRADLRLLDLGCSGGGLVRSVLEDGYVAIGLEGSDASKKLMSGEWATIPLHLFTCDITQPFRVLNSAGEPVLFHVVTAWEVLEHIPEAVLGGLIDNIAANVTDDGYFIASVDTCPDGNPLKGAVYHVTLRSKEWWLEQFSRRGFCEVTSHPFATRDYVRGNGLGSGGNWDPSHGDGFHLVLQRRRPGPAGDRG